MVGLIGEPKNIDHPNLADEPQIIRVHTSNTPCGPWLIVSVAQSDSDFWFPILVPLSQGPQSLNLYFQVLLGSYIFLYCFSGHLSEVNKRIIEWHSDFMKGVVSSCCEIISGGQNAQAFPFCNAPAPAEASRKPAMFHTDSEP